MGQRGSCVWRGILHVAGGGFGSGVHIPSWSPHSPQGLLPRACPRGGACVSAHFRRPPSRAL